MKLIRNLMLAAVAALSIAGPQAVRAQDTQQAVAQDSVIETIKRRGVLKVGMATFVPWAMRDKNGDLIGFEIDVATKLAEDMGVEVEFVPTAWDGIIPALISGKFDVIIGGMSITPARNLTVNFTDPYAHSSVGVMAHIAESEGKTWPDDFNATDVTFSCRRGATPCEYIKTHFPKATLRLFDDQAQVVQEVLNGNATVMLSSQPLPAFTIYENPDVVFSPTDTPIDPSNEAFALRKGDPDALNFFNNWILMRTGDGWLAERHDYWFGGRPWADLVPD
ncbi:MAG: amino acid ABC transporter substrate-binding protein [Confluentimicrobium sp.]|jgi:polar amino acid transport system substrate-binding protein|uniref:transporter substrate-binding domain-containing protein n=1 Tax=Actibacterium sp. TaxID=1872125 RepID=UPI00050DA1AC|nr:transporter substrate-binding domain-containing protein [Actibacterium sp.]KGB81279.1 amino acid ABC transporter substrate-binding protein [Rhodovulum sp. NI22]MBC57197.1 amino acid ABC transporter substrate-binding protein [Actibacterium sp.]MDY6859822.1 transporter substrate-binding domain-containing protein [Pseudomonadota bacterium]|tara:strand:+ start:1066 stop:1899 length:834 start_codon:yes stop_codon:yes gene_type:complete